MIYVFGNSHAHLFTNSPPGQSGWGFENDKFKSFSLGPVIAYNFMEHHFNTMINTISNSDIKSDDHILLAIGEVDCRWHLPYQASIQNKSIYEIVEECVERFFRAHISLKSLGYNVIGWGGHPSTTKSYDDSVEKFNPQEPIFGDCLYRNSISKLWEELLKIRCVNNKIPFVSIIDHLINDDGLTRMEYFNDYCHLNYEKTLTIIQKEFSIF